MSAPDRKLRRDILLALAVLTICIIGQYAAGYRL